MTTSLSKRVLYIDRDEPRRFAFIEKNLREKFNVEVAGRLHGDLPDQIHEEHNLCPYDAIVTHLPITIYPGGHYEYCSLEHLANLRRQMPTTPVVIYTDAVPRAVVSAGIYADGVVKKSGDFNKDFNFIIACLERSWAYWETYADPGPPRLREADGWTLVEATVRLRGAIDPAAACYIARECKNIKGKALMSGPSPDEASRKSVDSKDLFAIWSLCIKEGAIVRFAVEGHSEEARRLARRLYGGVVSRYSGIMDFTRFDSNDPPWDEPFKA
jgi:phosphotransferase system HPr-like phosphotransfer protein